MLNKDYKNIFWGMGLILLFSPKLIFLAPFVCIYLFIKWKEAEK